MIVFDKRSPVYEQIVAYFKAEIVSKRLKPGQEMPSRRELAQVMQVNPNTVQRAFHEMEAIGLVTTGNNVMSRVTEDEDSFNAKKGEVTALIGVNGIGKTTIMNSIAGLLPYDKGQIVIDDMPVRKVFAEKVSYITDSSIISPNQTVDEAIDFMRTFYPNWNRAKEKHLLKFFRLNLKDEVRSLSKGNVAKLNLLLGMGLDTEYILMDEPFSGIDVFTREEIARVFTSDLLDGRGVLITTHEINDIEYIVDKALLLDGGKIVKEFYPEQVREEEGKSIVDVMREVYLQ